MTELDPADTFLNVAATSSHKDTQKRNIANARKAHDAVVRFATREALTDSELLIIPDRLHALRKRLGNSAEVPIAK